MRRDSTCSSVYPFARALNRRYASRCLCSSVSSASEIAPPMTSCTIPATPPTASATPCAMSMAALICTLPRMSPMSRPMASYMSSSFLRVSSAASPSPLSSCRPILRASRPMSVISRFVSSSCVSSLTSAARALFSCMRYPSVRLSAVPYALAASSTAFSSACTICVCCLICAFRIDVLFFSRVSASPVRSNSAFATFISLFSVRISLCASLSAALNCLSPSMLRRVLISRTAMSAASFYASAHAPGAGPRLMPFCSSSYRCRRSKMSMISPGCMSMISDFCSPAISPYARHARGVSGLPFFLPVQRAPRPCPPCPPRFRAGCPG